MTGASTLFLERTPVPPGDGPRSVPDPEALFREARRRRRRRWIFATVAVAVLVSGAVVIGGRASHGLGTGRTGAGRPATPASTGRVRTFRVVSAGMAPTLLPGDRVDVDTPGAPLHIGSVVVFDTPRSPGAPAPGIAYEIKRVVGLPGQTIALSGDTVFIDGLPLSEPYLPAGQPLGPAIPALVIPAGHYYVLGDNRTNSEDSRFYGPIPAASVVGVVTSIVAPPSRAGPIAGSGPASTR